VDQKQDILFLGMSQVEQAQDLFFWEGGEGQNRSGPKTRLFLFLGTSQVDQKRDFFSFGGGEERKQDFGDNWIPETLSCRWQLDGLFLQRYGGMCTCTHFGTARSNRVLPNYSGGKN
jgi:hypothetical protein